MDKRGKLIVIDGSDGVGKATQTKLLVERLRREKVPVETLDFPQYERNLFGALIGECLAGEHGDFVGLDPKIASVLYAADRFESKKQIEGWLSKGKVVVLDRYVSANQMHQGGKIKDPKKRRAFLAWLDTMEHGVFGLPRPDLILCLALPTELSLALLRQKNTRATKTYLSKKQQDQTENNYAYLLESQQQALKLIKTHNAWKKITCARSGVILPRETIHDLVYAEVVRLLHHKPRI